MSRSVLKSLKRLAAHLPLSRQAAIVRRVMPRAVWYRTALTMARLQGKLVEQMGGNAAFTTAMMLDFWLRELSFGGVFPIPYRVTGAEVCRTPGAKLYTWTHLPLTEVPLRVGLEVGGEAPAVVADYGKIVNEREFLVFGWKEHIEAIPADEYLVRHVRAKLKEGRPVVFLADPFLGGELTDLPLRIAAKVGVPVVFQWAELAEDGVLDVEFRLAPRPMSEDDAAVGENLAFLRERNHEALARLGWNRG